MSLTIIGLHYLLALKHWIIIIPVFTQISILHGLFRGGEGGRIILKIQYSRANIKLLKTALTLNIILAYCLHHPYYFYISHGNAIKWQYTVYNCTDCPAIYLALIFPVDQSECCMLGKLIYMVVILPYHILSK